MVGASPPPAGSKTPRRGGRPTKADAGQLADRIIDVATSLFFEFGYGAVSIESVALRAGISKRTFYHRFDNKSALFSAVVHRTIERMRPPAGVPLLQGANIEQLLLGLARIILRAALSPHGIALNRLLVAESGRFPDLAAVVAKEGASEEAIRLIAGLLEREARAGTLKLENAVFAAEQFLYMVIAVPQRRAMGLGVAMTAVEADAWASNVVNLFLNGCRGWEAANARAKE